MAAKWQWGGIVGIYVDEAPQEAEVRQAELFVLDGTSSTLHFFGAGSTHQKLRGLIIGDTAKNQLLTDARANTTRVLGTPYSSGSFKIHSSPTFTPIRYVSADIDGTTYDGAVTPIYRVDLELVAL